MYKSKPFRLKRKTIAPQNANSMSNTQPYPITTFKGILIEGYPYLLGDLDSVIKRETVFGVNVDDLVKSIGTGKEGVYIEWIHLRLRLNIQGLLNILMNIICVCRSQKSK